MRIATPEENEGIDALMEQGYETITGEMLEEWTTAKRRTEEEALRVKENAFRASARISETEVPDDSISPAEPSPASRKRGRPAKEALWILLAAQYVAEGSTLRKALRRLGMDLPRAERKYIYPLKRLAQSERQRLEME